jgi:hypothetical protein
MGVGLQEHVDLDICGLTTGWSDSLGAFAMNITFDDNILALDSVGFVGTSGTPLRL